MVKQSGKQGEKKYNIFNTSNSNRISMIDVGKQSFIMTIFAYNELGDIVVVQKLECFYNGS